MKDGGPDLCGVGETMTLEVDAKVGLLKKKVPGRLWATEALLASEAAEVVRETVGLEGPKG